MNNDKVDDDMLMALADGELDPRQAADLSVAVARDADLARRLDMFRRTRRISRDAYARVLSEPAPARLVEAILAAPAAEPAAAPARSTVLPFAPRGKPSVLPFALPLAACLLLAIGGGGGYFLGLTGGGPQPTDGDWFSGSTVLAARFESQPSGGAAAVEVGGEPSSLSLLGTYRVADGLCRSFALDRPGDGSTLRGLACDRGGGYEVEVAARDAGGGDGFSPASEGAAGSIEAYLDAAGASAPLTREEEAAIFRGPPS